MKVVGSSIGGGEVDTVVGLVVGASFLIDSSVMDWLRGVWFAGVSFLSSVGD